MRSESCPNFMVRIMHLSNYFGEIGPKFFHIHVSIIILQKKIQHVDDRLY